MDPTNLIIIMADEHNSSIMGNAGHPIVKTPNLDKLAAAGTKFSNAYTNSPLCVPARASFATGRYVHDIGYWDTAHPYDGRVKGWGHRLQETGHPVSSIGKLHYRKTEDPTGFDEQIIPMHVVEGKGDVPGAIREGDVPAKNSCKKIADKIGSGDSTYIQYDRNITQKSCEWLEEKASQKSAQPWVLFVSMVCPHYPLVAPQEFFEMYPLDQIPVPEAVPKVHSNHHPWMQAIRNYWVYDDFLNEESRRIGVAAYFGLCSFIDHNVGRIIKSIEDNGLTESTSLIYVSDHGESLGKRGMWGKMSMYQESASIPLIATGPGIPINKVCSTPVTLVDFYQTIIKNAGEALIDDEVQLPGKSLFEIANTTDEPDRIAFSEYHAAGSPSAAYMIRRGKYKYIHYVNYEPELFDLESDPEEKANLAGDVSYNSLLGEFSSILNTIVDPMTVDKHAKADQAALIEQNGGRDAVLQRGSYGQTPTPGEKIVYVERPD